MAIAKFSNLVIEYENQTYKQEGDSPSCIPAEKIGVQTFIVTNITGTKIKIMEDASYYRNVLRTVPAGAEIKIKDYYMPDLDHPFEDGTPGAGKKWWKVVGGGWVAKNQVSEVPQRLVTGYIYNGNQKYLIFNDNTCKAVRPPVTQYTVPMEGKFAMALHDWQREDYDYKPRIGPNHSVPETVPLWAKPDFYVLTPAWQRLWLALQRWASNNVLTRGQLITAWADITADRKALTDNHSRTEGFWDVISRYNPNSVKGYMCQKGLLMGGSMVHVLYGETIEALDITKDPPTLAELIKKPWLWGWTTEIFGGPKYSNNTYPVSSWPNFTKFGGYGVPYLIIGPDGKNILRREHRLMLTNGQVYSPYNSAPK